MIDYNSRYYNLPNKIYENENNTKIVYKNRRIIPQMNSHNSYIKINLVAGDRLDLLSAKWLGDPLQYWQICDVNPVILNPVDLIKAGESIMLPTVI